MRTKLIKAALPLGMFAVLLVSPAATATPVCAGTENVGGICADVDPDGRPVADDCVYVGPPPCIPVTVTAPDVVCQAWGAPAGSWECWLI